MITTTIKLHDHNMEELKAIAKEERRSVGFLIRDAIVFQLTEHHSKLRKFKNKKNVQRVHADKKINGKPGPQSLRMREIFVGRCPRTGRGGSRSGIVGSFCDGLGKLAVSLKAMRQSGLYFGWLSYRSTIRRRKVRKKISPTQVPTASAGTVASCQSSYSGEASPAHERRLKTIKNFCAETPKQIKPASKYRKNNLGTSKRNVAAEEKKKSWYTPCESADDTPEIILLS